MKYIVEVKYTNPAHEHVSLRRRVDTVSRVVEARSEEEAINRVANQQRALGFMIREAKVIRPNSLKEEIEQLEEKLSANDSASKWISDFVKSDNPKFAGKSKKERIRMALGAYYAAKREKNEAVDLKKIAAKKTERNKINMKPTVSDTRIHEETDTIQVDNQHLLNNIEMVDKDSQEEQEFKDKYFDRVRELEESEWKELWDILKGPDYSKFDKNKDWESQYDGSGLKSWWD